MKRVSSDNVAKNDAILSQGIKTNSLIFVSGQIHADSNWKLIGETPKEKFAACMNNVQAILEASNSSVSSIVKVTIFITDMSMIAEINEVYASYFGDTLPAREAIGVAALPLGASIEIVVVAEAE